MLSYDSYLKVQKAIQNGRSDEARNILSAFTTDELVDACITLLRKRYTPIRFVRLVDEILRSRGDQTLTMPTPFPGDGYMPASWADVHMWDDFIAKAGCIYFDSNCNHSYNSPMVPSARSSTKVAKRPTANKLEFPKHVMEPEDAFEFLEARKVGFTHEAGFLTFQQAYYIASVLKKHNVPRPSELVTAIVRDIETFEDMDNGSDMDSDSGTDAEEDGMNDKNILSAFIALVQDSVSEWDWPSCARDALYAIRNKWKKASSDEVPVDLSSIRLPEKLPRHASANMLIAEKELLRNPQRKKAMVDLVHEYLSTRAYETDMFLVDGEDRLFACVHPTCLLDSIHIAVTGSFQWIPTTFASSKWFARRMCQILHLQPGDLLVTTVTWGDSFLVYWMFNGTNAELVATSISRNNHLQCPPGYLSIIPPGFFDGACNRWMDNFIFEVSTEELRAMAPDNAFKCIEIPTFCTHTAEYREDPDDLPPTTAAISLETPYGPVLLIAMPAWWDDWECASDVIIEPCRSVSSERLLQLLSCSTTELVAANKGRATVEVDGTSYTLVGIAVHDVDESDE